MFSIFRLLVAIGALRSKIIPSKTIKILKIYSTRDGANDQENYETIYTVGPILKIVRPRIATLEQTSGLATSQEHRGNFLMLLGDIGEAGYDIRYKIQDLSELGLAQRRKRLLIIAARYVIGSCTT